MANNVHITGEDLARPAKELPLKVIRELGHLLHRHLQNSGNWETIAEDLGYEFENIKQFNNLSGMGHEMTPGEIMLRDWVQRSNGCTLFVLHDALCKANRTDCVQCLESGIKEKVIYMNLMVCVKNERSNETSHRTVRTRTDASLLDSLQNVLEQPVQSNYKLCDAGTSWTGTKAKEYKGRQVMLLRTNISAPLDQDPTVDSSNPGLGNSQEFRYVGNSQNSRRSSQENMLFGMRNMRASHGTAKVISRSMTTETRPVVTSSFERCFQQEVSLPTGTNCVSCKILSNTINNNINNNNNLNLECPNSHISSNYCNHTGNMNISSCENKIQNLPVSEMRQGSEIQVSRPNKAKTDKVSPRP